MSFLYKTNYFPILTGDWLCVSNNDGHSQSVAEAMDENGTLIANTVYGPTYSPSNSYIVANTVSASAGDVQLGAVFQNDIGYVVLNNITINTQAGQAPTVNMAGESVEDGATATCTYSLPAFALAVTHHAQILFSAFTLAGTGCYLQSASYTASATVTKATREGTPLSHDVSQARIDAQLTIT